MSYKGQDYAQMLIRKLKVDSVPVCPIKIAEQLDITIKEFDAGDDFDGCLVNKDGAKGILLNNKIDYEPRKNFTIAHEIGHSEIPGHLESEKKCRASDISDMFGIREPEKEANDFAANLLMPEFYMDEVSYREVSVDGIQEISNDCNTSFTSSALQYIKFCPEIAAIIFIENGKVKNFSRTEEAAKRGLFFNPGTTISKASIAAEFLDSNGTVNTSGQNRDEVDARVWCPDMDYSVHRCIEDVIALPTFNQVVSLLYFEEKD